MGVSRWLPDVIAGPRGRSALALAVYYWSIRDWYLDSVNGSDTNSGTTAGTALRTAEELSRRLAVSVPIDHAVTVHVAQGSYGTLAIRVIQTALACPFDVIGYVAYTDIGTVTSYTDRVAASNINPHLVASGVSDWTAHAGKRVDVTSGAQTGAACWVCAANPVDSGGAPLGVAVARTSRCSTPSSTGYSPSPVVPAAGSSLRLASLPHLEALSLDVVGILPNPGVTTLVNRGSRIQSLSVDAVQLNSSTKIIVDRCSVGDPIVTSRPLEGRHWFSNCLIRGMGTDLQLDCLNIYYGAIGHQNCVLAWVTLLLNSYLSGCSVQGIYLNPQQSCFVGGCGIFGAATQAAVTFGSASPTLSTVSGCWGSGNKYGLTVAKHTICSAPSVSYVTGSLGDIYLPGQTAVIPWTALPWVDGERSGEVALVAGTRQVTVPYVLSTQTIMATCKTPGGTLGFLRAYYVNSTTIQIDSLTAAGTPNNLDTSTITWRINATGDNAVIRS
jgi:hypothetical protein